MRTAKEIWRGARDLLRTDGAYGTFLLGMFCLMFVGWVAMILISILSVIGFLILNGVLDSQAIAAAKEMPLLAFLKDHDPMTLKKIVQTLCHYPQLVAWGLGRVIPPLLVLFWLVGFSYWSGQAMGIACTRRGLFVTHAFSGWGHAWKMVSLIFWQQTFIGLKLLLLVVPGVRALFSYALAPYLLIDHPDWTSRQCLDESERLMNGHRWRLFKVSLPFVVCSLVATVVNYAADRFQVPLVRGLVQILMVLLAPYFGVIFAFFYENRLDESETGKRTDECVENTELTDEQETDEQERNPEDDEH